MLGTILETAPPPLRDLDAALDWYQRAAESGHAGAQNNLGAMYFDGRGVLRNPLEAASGTSSPPTRASRWRRPTSR